VYYKSSLFCLGVQTGAPSFAIFLQALKNQRAEYGMHLEFLKCSEHKPQLGDKQSGLSWYLHCGQVKEDALGRACSMRGEDSPYRILEGNPEGKRSLGRPRRV
jgi:hypothetical protein